jgi:O-acetyl-ADP-ribose deacetylase
MGRRKNILDRIFTKHQEDKMSDRKSGYTFPDGQVVEIAHGDITEETLDAIVNAANEYLQHGGGVAGAIVRKGGVIIQQESDRWVAENGPVTHINPAYTSAGRLACKYVIHAVGPVWGQGDEDARLSAAVHGCLRLAESLGLQSLAMPAISTGIFGFPKDRAAAIILTTIAAYFQHQPQSTLKLVRLTLFDQPTLSIFLESFNGWQSTLSAQ